MSTTPMGTHPAQMPMGLPRSGSSKLQAMMVGATTLINADPTPSTTRLISNR